MTTQAAVGRGVMTDRVRRLRAMVLDKPPVLSVQRLKIAQGVREEMEGEPALTVRARTFERYLDELPIIIDDNPIVGNITEHLVAVYPQPDYSCHWMTGHGSYGSQLGKISYSEEDGRVMDEAAAYWRGKCVYDRSLRAFLQARKATVEDFPMLKAELFTNAPGGHAMGTALNYGKVMAKGLNGVMAEVEEELAKLAIGVEEDERKRIFYDAVLVCHRAVIRRAERFAATARQMADEAADEDRRQELQKIAESIEWAPANPSRNFYEALLAFWFTFAAAQMMDIAVATTPGRLAQFLEPYYQMEKKAGLTQESAIELLELLFLRLQAVVFLRSARYWQTGMGQTNFHIALGGLTPEGDDATGEVDWLILEAQRRVRCIQPTLSVLVHDKLSPEFLLKAIEVIKESGLGQPALMNNETAILQLLRNYPEASLEEARSVFFYGCVPAKMPGTDNQWSGSFNMPKFLELALNNGRDPRTGLQVGPETGDADSFASLEQLETAILSQLRSALPVFADLARLGMVYMGQIVPLPFQSALIDDCIRKGKDVMEGGARYPYGLLGRPIGMIDVANSLAAIKSLVFDEKQLTMAQLREALAADFQGEAHADIHRRCLAAPKFGNDDPYADEIARRWYGKWYDEATKFFDHRGRRTIPRAFSISHHFGFGLRVGALPSGRRAGVSLTDAAVSAAPGTDRNGPTALVKSAASAIDCTKYDGNHLNMKFHPSSLATRDGMKKLVDLVHTYMDLGGYHVQFNVVSAETLKDAQLRPENYRDLVVRVAGFSAFYVLLDKAVQDEIIKRTELRLV